MRRSSARTFILAALLASAASAALAAPKDDPSRKQFTFSWQFQPGDRMAQRGGTTKGAPLTLATEPSDAWRALQEPGLTKLERDRRAILAMAGGYRATFDFVETV